MSWSKTCTQYKRCNKCPLIGSNCKVKESILKGKKEIAICLQKELEERLGREKSGERFQDLLWRACNLDEKTRKLQKAG